MLGALLPYTYQWDMMIAFPPCTRLAVSGARWWKDKQAEQIQAIKLFMLFANADIPKIAYREPHRLDVEPMAQARPDIHPWQFGHGETKGTCLWLKGLPLLQPWDIVNGAPRVYYYLLESKTVLPDSNGVQSLTPALPPHLPSNGANPQVFRAAVARLSAHGRLLSI